MVLPTGVLCALVAATAVLPWASAIRDSFDSDGLLLNTDEAVGEEEDLDGITTTIAQGRSGRKRKDITDTSEEEIRKKLAATFVQATCQRHGLQGLWTSHSYNFDVRIEGNKATVVRDGGSKKWSKKWSLASINVDADSCAVVLEIQGHKSKGGSSQKGSLKEGGNRVDWEKAGGGRNADFWVRIEEKEKPPPVANKPKKKADCPAVMKSNSVCSGGTELKKQEQQNGPGERECRAFCERAGATCCELYKSDPDDGKPDVCTAYSANARAVPWTPQPSEGFADSFATMCTPKVSASSSPVGSIKSHPQQGIYEQQVDWEAALPPGWDMFVSEEGKPYYHNAEKEVTQWERPLFQLDPPPRGHQVEPDSSSGRSGGHVPAGTEVCECEPLSQGQYCAAKNDANNKEETMGTKDDQESLVDKEERCRQWCGRPGVQCCMLSYNPLSKEYRCNRYSSATLGSLGNDNMWSSKCKAGKACKVVVPTTDRRGSPGSRQNRDTDLDALDVKRVAQTGPISSWRHDSITVISPKQAVEEEKVVGKLPVPSSQVLVQPGDGVIVNKQIGFFGPDAIQLFETGICREVDGSGDALVVFAGGSLKGVSKWVETQFFDHIQVAPAFKKGEYVIATQDWYDGNAAIRKGSRGQVEEVLKLHNHVVATAEIPIHIRYGQKGVISQVCNHWAITQNEKAVYVDFLDTTPSKPQSKQQQTLKVAVNGPHLWKLMVDLPFDEDGAQIRTQIVHEYASSMKNQGDVRKVLFDYTPQRRQESHSGYDNVGGTTHWQDEAEVPLTAGDGVEVVETLDSNWVRVVQLDKVTMEEADPWKSGLFPVAYLSAKAVVENHFGLDEKVAVYDSQTANWYRARTVAVHGDRVSVELLDGPNKGERIESILFNDMNKIRDEWLVASSLTEPRPKGRVSKKKSAQAFEVGSSYVVMYDIVYEEDPHTGKKANYVLGKGASGVVQQVDEGGNALMKFDSELDEKWVAFQDLRFLNKLFLESKGTLQAKPIIKDAGKHPRSDELSYDGVVAINPGRHTATDLGRRTVKLALCESLKGNSVCMPDVSDPGPGLTRKTVQGASDLETCRSGCEGFDSASCCSFSRDKVCHVYFGKAGTLVDISAGMSSALCSADTSAQAAPHANGAWDKSLRFILCVDKTQQQYKAEPYRVTFLDKDNDDFHYHRDSGAVAHLNTLKTPFPANYCAAWSPSQKVWYLLYRKGAEVQKEVERLFPAEMARAKAAKDNGQQKRAKK